jgi:hypothetical protein
MLMLIVTMGASMDQKDYIKWNALILEIFHLIFSNRNPEDILPESVRTFMCCIYIQNLISTLCRRKKRRKKISFKNYSKRRNDGVRQFL